VVTRNLDRWGMSMKTMLAWVFHNHASTGAIQCHWTVSIATILILIGIMEVAASRRSQLRGPTILAESFHGFSQSLQTCQYSTSNMPTSASFHKFPPSLPTVPIFQGRESSYQFVTLLTSLRFAVTGYGPWKQLWCPDFTEYVCFELEKL
jgi:hypothetical protein